MEVFHIFAPMLRKISTTCLLVFCTITGFAQSTITGVLKDSLTQEGEPYATIRVYKGQNQKEPVAMGVSGLEGEFQQKVSGKGKYTITFNSVGRKEIRRAVTLDDKSTIDLGTLWITDDAQQLQGVDVVAQKPLVKMETDKMTYNVQDDVEAKSATVLDMLRKVPMVTVDGQDNITVNGSSSFKIYVNGKPNMMFNSNPSQIFKAMPASMVKNIEVITNPGAKYDAEGTGGVLNLTMVGQGESQAQINGINGNVRLDAGNKGTGIGSFLSGQYGKFSFSLNGIINNGRTKGTEVEIERKNLTNGSSYMLRQKGDTRMLFGMTNLNMSYEIDTMSTIGLSAGFHSWGMKNTGKPTTTISDALGDSYTYGEDSRTKNRNNSLEASLDYQRFLNKARTSSISLIYQFNYDPTRNNSSNIIEWVEDDDLTTDMLPDRFSDSREKTITHVAQADYTTPLAENHKLNTGVKLTHRNSSSDASFKTNIFMYDPLSSTSSEQDVVSYSKHKHTDDIMAGYAEYEGKFGKFGAKAGLRYEHTWQKVEFRTDDGEDFHKDYGNLVPTASLSWQMLSFANLGLTYNMRISRPGISYLNPYVDRSSTSAITYGNPNLSAEKSHQIGLVYNMYTPMFMANVNVRQNINNNAISQYSFYDDVGLLNTTYGNIMRQRSTTMSIWASLMLSKKTRIFMNAGGGYFHMESRAEDSRNHGWQGNLMAGIQQTLPWDLKLNTFFITNSKKYSLQGWSTGFNMLTASLSKSLLNDKLDIGIRGMTGLRKGGRFYFDSYSSGRDFQNHQSTHVPVANVTLSITWNFGNSKVKAKTKTTRVEDDTVNQTNSMEQMGNMQGQGM